jgi:hypothetical protein
MSSASILASILAVHLFWRRDRRRRRRHLLCPAVFDLGGAARVAIVSVTVGEASRSEFSHMRKRRHDHQQDRPWHLDLDVRKTTSLTMGISSTT